ncbi:MAG TPA: ABC transporter ATP-binding protein [Burkholderiales bacterium]|nr:ABC transporter ATP-binding protein [Burkholderiales bacterium]
MQQPAIELSAVRFAWKRGAADVLDIESLRVARGERVFVRGASGSGKSTLLGLIGGVSVPGGGRLDVLGRDIGAMSGAARDSFRADHVGFIFQMFNLIPYLSVIENVCLPCGFSPRRCERACGVSASIRAEARRLLEHLDMADAALLRKPATELSVGQQQRVAAARALIGAPEIVIADEPTSALDADRREAFVELLFRECAAAGATLVFVSHDAALGPRFDRVVDLAAVNRAAA